MNASSCEWQQLEHRVIEKCVRLHLASGDDWWSCTKSAASTSCERRGLVGAAKADGFITPTRVSLARRD